MSGIVLFVYGTLKRGLKNHHLLAGQEFLGTARTMAGYRVFDCGPYPGLVEDSRGIAVTGELWQVDDEALRVLDAFEGVPTLFDRREVRMESMAGPVFAYYYVRDTSGLRDCGGVWGQRDERG